MTGLPNKTVETEMFAAGLVRGAASAKRAHGKSHFKNAKAENGRAKYIRKRNLALRNRNVKISFSIIMHT